MTTNIQSDQTARKGKLSASQAKKPRYFPAAQLRLYGTQPLPSGLPRVRLAVQLFAYNFVYRSKQSLASMRNPAWKLRRLQDPHHRPVPAPLARPSADGPALHSARVCRTEGRRARDGLPPRRIRPAGPLQLPRPRAGRLDRADGVNSQKYMRKIDSSWQPVSTLKCKELRIVFT